MTDHNDETTVERACTVIQIDTLNDGTYRAYQTGVDAEGIGPNPARAVVEFAAEVERRRYA